MRYKSVKEIVALGIVKGLITLGLLLFFSTFSECGASADITNFSETLYVEQPFKKLNPDEVTTEWKVHILQQPRRPFKEKT